MTNLTKVRNVLLKSFFMLCAIGMMLTSCSNEELISSVSSLPSTPVIGFDSTDSDSIGAVLLEFDGSEFGAATYSVTATCVSDMQIDSKTVETIGTSYIYELPVAKYQFTVVGHDIDGNIKCVGTTTLTLTDDKDITASVSFIEADNNTKISYTSSSGDGFLFEFVDTLCIGETKNVQLQAGDNWFGFIGSSSKTVYLQWLTSTSVQNVIVYQDGRSDDSVVSGIMNSAKTQYSVTTSSGQHCYYIRIVATQAVNECQLTLVDNISEVPTTTTTTIPTVVTTTSTTTTSTTTTTTTTIPGTSTTTTVVPTEYTATPVITYSLDNSKVSVTCKTAGAVIFYTTNGSEPTLSSTKYTEPFEIAGGVTVNAIAIADGYLCSEMASYTSGRGVKINIEFEEDSFDGIRVLVAGKLGYSMIHYWDSSDANAYPATSWPGVALAKYDDSDYYYEFKSVSSIKLLITNASGGKLCGTDMVLSEKGTYRITSSGASLVDDTPTTTTTSTTTTTVYNDSYNGIQIQVSKSLNNGGFGYIHYWLCSDAVTYPGTAWPGVKMDDSISDSYYIYNFDMVSSVNLLITDGSSNKLCSTDMSITKKGAYLITVSGVSDSSYITSAPVKPSCTLPTSATLNGTFNIRVVSNVALTAATVKIGSTSKTLSIGDNLFSVNDFVTKAGTLSVSGTLTNEAGSTSVSGSITISEAPTVNTNVNALTIYQVMVSSFQDGDSSIGYSTAYGPNIGNGTITGGDLQGIINAADYIKDLGCNALWMTPIFQSAGNSQLDSTGYFCSDYFNVDYHFGTNDKLKELVKTYHEKGMYVILDGVFGHHGGSVAQSPNGKSVSGTNPVNYPASLDFYKEVAEYWIKNYDIDGWRLDQCYQVGLGDNGKNCATGGHNYWYDIRKVVKSAAEANKSAGKEWGTLGYMVGEHWNGDAAAIQAGSVAKGSAEGYGLQSCFDFPSRYKLVQSLATEESRGKSDLSLGEALSYTFSTSSQKGYVHDEGYYPNLFITNHDLVRFGNLLNWKFSISPSSGDSYWGRHRIAMATLAVYTGPVTIYYGDEWGAYVDGYTGSGSLGAYNDNAARSNGKISGFNSNEQALIDYTKKLLAARSSNEAMWNGTNATVSSTSSFYVGKKIANGNTIIYGINNSSSQQTFSASGTVLADNDENGTSVSGTAKVAPYSATFILQN